MIDGVLTVCGGCWEDVPVEWIRHVHADEGVVHCVWACERCDNGSCHHMNVTDYEAVEDYLGVRRGREPLGFLSFAERSLVRFREQLDEVETVADLEERWDLTL